MGLYYYQNFILFLEFRFCARWYLKLLFRGISWIIMKRLKGLFNIRLDVWCSRKKKLLKLPTISIGLVRSSLLFLKTDFGNSDSFAFRKIIALFPFHAFFISLIIFLKWLVKWSLLLCFIKVDRLLYKLYTYYVKHFYCDCYI